MKSWLFGSAPSIPLPPRYYTHPASRWSANQNSPLASSVAPSLSPISIFSPLSLSLSPSFFADSDQVGYANCRFPNPPLHAHSHPTPRPLFKTGGEGAFTYDIRMDVGPSRARSSNILLSPSNHIHQKLRTDIINESTSKRERGAPQQPMSEPVSRPIRLVQFLPRCDRRTKIRPSHLPIQAFEAERLPLSL